MKEARHECSYEYEWVVIDNMTTGMAATRGQGDGL